MDIKKVDILIIGSGASGSAAAWNLSKSGFKILCLEQGESFNPKSYSFLKNDWEYLKQKEFNINPNVRKLKSDYPINDSNSPISIANFNAVGGSTILYSGHFPRFHPSDFKTKSLDDVGSDWPINYNELKPYYETNEKIMGVAGLENDPANPGIKNLMPPVDIGFSGELMAKTFNKLNWHWWPSYSAIKKINKNKFEKSDVNSTYWPKAIKQGVKLKTNCRVSKIILNKKGLAKGVEYFERNKKKYLNASLIILACSGLGTPRLLLNSSNELFPKGLANSSGLVGKNLMLHPLGFVEGKFRNFLGSFLGLEGCCIFSQEFYETRKVRNFKRGYTMQILRGSHPLETALSLRKFNKLKFGKKFHNSFLDTYGYNIPIAIICEDLPEKSNYVELDYAQKDSNGLPGVKINYKLSNNSKRMMSHGLSRGRELMIKAGAKSLISFGPVKNTGWHIMGTAKMGKLKKNSVVNKFGQTHDIKNLVIVDSSVFPTSSGVNPASTIQALALKFTDEIRRKPNNYFTNDNK